MLKAAFFAIILAFFDPVCRRMRKKAGKLVPEDFPDALVIGGRRIERMGWLESQVYTERSKLN